MPGSGSKILIVDDDPGVVATLRAGLEREGYHCYSVTSGEQALAEVRETQPDLILLDRVLPGLPGDDVVVRLKRDPRSKMIPIIMLSGKGEEVDEVVGLTLGADDYVSKPFSIKRVVARVRAHLRQQTAVAEDYPSAPPASIVLDRSQPRVFIDQSAITLTPPEYRLLAALIAARGHVLDRAKLEKLVRGDRKSTRRIDDEVDELRRKLGPASAYIQSIPGDGYAFCYPPGPHAPA